MRRGEKATLLDMKLLYSCLTVHFSYPCLFLTSPLFCIRFFTVIHTFRDRLSLSECMTLCNRCSFLPLRTLLLIRHSSLLHLIPGSQVVHFHSTPVHLPFYNQIVSLALRRPKLLQPVSLTVCFTFHPLTRASASLNIREKLKKEKTLLYVMRVKLAYYFFHLSLCMMHVVLVFSLSLPFFIPTTATFDLRVK